MASEKGLTLVTVRPLHMTGRTAEIANMSSPAFLDELGRRKIPINYDINDLHADLASIRDAH
jgi:predicted HTH domain antitoxin